MLTVVPDGAAQTAARDRRKHGNAPTCDGCGRLRKRSRQSLVAVREEERRRLHRELHDGIGPTLAAIAMQVDVVMALLRSDPDAAEDTLRRVAAAAQEITTEVRRVMEGLRPRVLDQFGLIGAIRHKVDTFNAPDAGGRGVHVDVDARGSFLALPPAIELAAYRIATESIANAVRHGRAHRCRVVLHGRDVGIVVQVVDDGTGLPRDVTPGVGLRSMAQRAGELGGTFHAKALSAGGTAVTAYLPASAMEEVR